MLCPWRIKTNLYIFFYLKMKRENRKEWFGFLIFLPNIKNIIHFLMKHLFLLIALLLSQFFIHANNDTLPKPYITKPPPEITPSFAIGLQASFTFGFAKTRLALYNEKQWLIWIFLSDFVSIISTIGSKIYFLSFFIKTINTPISSY